MTIFVPLRAARSLIVSAWPAGAPFGQVAVTDLSGFSATVIGCGSASWPWGVQVPPAAGDDAGAEEDAEEADEEVSEESVAEDEEDPVAPVGAAVVAVAVAEEPDVTPRGPPLAAATDPLLAHP